MVDSTSNIRHKSSPLDGPRKFYKDSVLFLHRCTKPDRRGTLIISYSPFTSTFTIVFYSRILEGLASCFYRFRFDGLHRILCQTCSHPN